MSKTIKLPDDPDAPIRGAELIALAGNVLTKDGEPNTALAYSMLEKGYLPATKVGAIWTSTTRRVRTPATENGSYPVPSTDSGE
jgi:hypothetical protein